MAIKRLERKMSKTVKTDQEIWKQISGFSLYDVSNFGRIRSWYPRGGKGCRNRKPTIMNTNIRKGSERTKLISDNGKVAQVIIARAVCLAFLDAFPIEGAIAIHKNGDACDNRLENLRWGGFSDALRTPHSLLVQSVARRKWDKETANKVRRLYRKGTKVVDIAAMIEGMTPGNVTNIATSGYPDATELPCESRTTHHGLGKPRYYTSNINRHGDDVALRVIERVAMGQTVKQAATDEGVSYQCAWRWTSGKARAYLGEEFRAVIERKCLDCGVVITQGKRCPVCAKPHNRERKMLDMRQRNQKARRKRMGYVDSK
jgi:hypothetical protein